MTVQRWAAVAAGLLAAAMLTGCSCSKADDGPRSAAGVDVPALSANDRRTLKDDSQAIPEFVESTADLPIDAPSCQAQLNEAAQRSVEARTRAADLESTDLQGLLVNHSAAVWDYLRLCAAGDDTAKIEQELAFYQEVLNRWLGT